MSRGPGDPGPSNGPNVIPKRRLGQDGPTLTTLGLGSWAIGGPYEFGWGRVSDTESIQAIRHAVEQGLTWVDTAPVYGVGHSEEIVGEALKPWRIGEDVFVFTKCGRNYYGGGGISSDLRPETIRSECEQSLRRLGVERIDLYQFHWPDPDTGTPIEESWATMEDLAREGKVRWVGLSNFDVPLLERCEAIRHVDSLQPPLNLLNPESRTTVIPWCRDHGTGVIAYAPLANGLLTGAYDRARIHSLAQDDWRRRAPHFNEPALSKNLLVVDRLKAIAKRHGTSVAELSIGWVLATPGVTGAIVGARRADQVDGWIGAASLNLTEAALDEIDTGLALAREAEA
jgi:aryl-alcohol dehydrogenase-like predicted oxidoreductase